VVLAELVVQETPVVMEMKERVEPEILVIQEVVVMLILDLVDKEVVVVTAALVEQRVKAATEALAVQEALAVKEQEALKEATEDLEDKLVMVVMVVKEDIPAPVQEIIEDMDVEAMEDMLVVVREVHIIQNIVRPLDIMQVVVDVEDLDILSTCVDLLVAAALDIMELALVQKVVVEAAEVVQIMVIQETLALTHVVVIMVPVVAADLLVPVVAPDVLEDLEIMVPLVALVALEPLMQSLNQHLVTLLQEPQETLVPMETQ